MNLLNSRIEFGLLVTTASTTCMLSTTGIVTYLYLFFYIYLHFRTIFPLINCTHRQLPIKKACVWIHLLSYLGELMLSAYALPLLSWSVFTTVPTPTPRCMEEEVAEIDSW